MFVFATSCVPGTLRVTWYLHAALSWSLCEVWKSIARWQIIKIRGELKIKHDFSFKQGKVRQAFINWQTSTWIEFLHRYYKNELWILTIDYVCDGWNCRERMSIFELQLYCEDRNFSCMAKKFDQTKNFVLGSVEFFHQIQADAVTNWLPNCI